MRAKIRRDGGEQRSNDGSLQAPPVGEVSVFSQMMSVGSRGPSSILRGSSEEVLMSAYWGSFMTCFIVVLGSVETPPFVLEGEEGVTGLSDGLGVLVIKTSIGINLFVSLSHLL